MTRPERTHRWDIGIDRSTAAAALTIAFALAVAMMPAAHAQTFTVLYSFTGGADGESPELLTIDRAGNLYGTSGGGADGYGGVLFKLSHMGSGWTFAPLHNFVRSEGIAPIGPTIGPDGNLYGVNNQGGGQGCGQQGCGTVFKVAPPPNRCTTVLCPWPATVLYEFTGGSDGKNPLSAVTFDQAGNLYGTAPGGSTGYGVVYELSPSSGGWQSVIYTFQGGGDGGAPEAGVILDAAGNLYGATYGGGTRNTGTIFQLSQSGSGWVKNTLYSFQDDPGGVFPDGSLIFDQSGNLYGTTGGGGDSNSNCPGGCGTVFSLSPSNGGWVHTVLYSFTGDYGDENPNASLTIDAAGNLYGTTTGSSDTAPYGNVFKLAPSSGGWIYTSLHEFTDGTDGGHPYSSAVMDANGNLYGTATIGGKGSDCNGLGCGVVWEVTP